MHLRCRQTKIYIQALFLISCLTSGKWLNLLASVSLYVRWECWEKNDNYITMCLAEL